MLTKDPQLRIQSMRQIGAELEAIAAGSGERPLVAPRAAAPAEPGLVGRAGELARLQQLLANANLGAGRVVVVTGEAGSGKTALCDAALGRIRSQKARWQIGIGHCLEHHGPSEAYSPFGTPPAGACRFLLASAPSSSSPSCSAAR